MTIRWRPAAPVDVLADETNHTYAVQLLRDALPGHPLRVHPVSDSALASSTPAIALPASAEPDPSLRQSRALDDLASLGPEGYSAAAGAGGRATVTLIGHDHPGVIYAVQELVERRLTVSPAGVEIAAFATRHQPALPYRLFWTW